MEGWFVAKNTYTRRTRQIFDIIKNMYNGIKACVTVNGAFIWGFQVSTTIIMSELEY